MRIVVIADTHAGHDSLGVLEGDILIHCGDAEMLFDQDDHMIDAIDGWFARQKVDHVLYVGGNHDVTLEKRVAAKALPFRNAVYLQDSMFTYQGVRFYGAPWVPELRGHAFFADDASLAAAWAEIPEGVDVLITHTPPAGVMDVSGSGLELGCPHLARHVDRANPRLHCFGHVHASSGTSVQDGRTYVNAALVNSNFEIARRPFVLDLTDDGVHLKDGGYHA